MHIILYHICIILLGYWIYKKFIGENSNVIFTGVISLTLGIIISVPLTYFLSILFQQSHNPIVVSVFVFSTIVIISAWIKRKKFFLFNSRKINIIDITVTFFSLVFSSYIMTKTLKIASDGSVFVAKNTIFDFGHSLSIIRSMSWGSNIPYTSPFVAGTEHVYHFMFYYYSAVLEHLGLPINYAVNIPSIIGFTLFLLIIYFIGKEFFRNSMIGILSVLLSLFHGGLMFIPFFYKYGISIQAILNNPDYFFTGPFDGSVYSIFLTLNVFVNQRHLGFALATFFLITFLLIEKKVLIQKIHLYGVFVGLFLLWHFMLSTGLFCVIFFYLLISREWKKVLLFCLLVLLISLPFLYPWIRPIAYMLVGIPSGMLSTQIISSVPHKNIIAQLLEFTIYNLGISLPFFFIGIFSYRKKIKDFLPLFILLFFSFVFSLLSGSIDQKYLNVFIVLFNIFVAVGVVYLWKFNSVIKIIIIFIFPFMIISGVIDMAVIKNDYLYSINSTVSNKLINWIRYNTDKTAVFISYRDIFDPVTLSGRKNYFGFYRQLYTLPSNFDQQRANIVAEIYTASDAATLQKAVSKTNAEYVMIPTKEKSEFMYKVDYDLMKKIYPAVLEDVDHIILKVK